MNLYQLRNVLIAFLMWFKKKKKSNTSVRDKIVSMKYQNFKVCWTFCFIKTLRSLNRYLGILLTTVIGFVLSTDICKSRAPAGHVNGCSVPSFLPHPFIRVFTPSCDKHDVCYDCVSTAMLYSYWCMGIQSILLACLYRI